MRGIRFPGRYIQGPKLLSRLGTFAAEFGNSALVVADPGVLGIVRADVEGSLHEASVSHNICNHSGICTADEIGKLVEQGRLFASAVVIGIGGGKTLDAAKSTANELGLPILVCPTIAASDAPCSALSVIYGPDGRVAHDQFLPTNPDLVLVDTDVIARAPARYLSAGMGDAIATYFEADACRQSGAHNCMGIPGTHLAFAIAKSCLEIIRADGKAALEECDRGFAGPALEKVVEANILMSGIGFESGGVAAAHAIHHGLCELDDVHDALHGEKVAIGVLAGLLLNNRQVEFEAMADLCRALRLPTRLAEIGVTDATAEKLRIVAVRACRPGEIIHNEPKSIGEEEVVVALRALA